MIRNLVSGFVFVFVRLGAMGGVLPFGIVRMCVVLNTVLGVLFRQTVVLAPVLGVLFS